MLRKLLVLAVSVVMVTGLLSGCGEDEEQTAATNDESQSVIQNTTDDNETKNTESNEVCMSELTFEKMSEIDTDGLYVQYGDILLEIGVTTPDDIDEIISNSELQLTTVSTNIGDTKIRIDAISKDNKEILSMFFYDFKADNTKGVEEGFHLYSLYIASNYSFKSNEYYLTADCIFYSDALIEFATENAATMGMDFEAPHNNIDLFNYYTLK